MKSFDGIVSFVASYEIPLIVISFLLGSVVLVSLFYRAGNKKKFWSWVDLVWIVVGGLSAASAIFVSVYVSNKGEFERELVGANADLRRVVSVGDGFVSRYCVNIPFGSLHLREMTTFCDITRKKVDFFSTGQDIFVFREINEFNEFSEDVNFAGIISEKVIEIPKLDENLGLWSLDCFSFRCTPLSFKQEDGLKEYFRSTFLFDEMISDHDALERQMNLVYSTFLRMQGEWQDVRSGLTYLAIRTFCLSLFAFVLPFRIGKSLREVVS